MFTVYCRIVYFVKCELMKCTINISYLDLGDHQAKTCKGTLHLTLLTTKQTPTPWPSPVSGDNRGQAHFSVTLIPRTCCSRVVIRVTACCSTPSFVCGFSWRMCSATIRSSSLNASFISRTRILSKPDETASHQYMHNYRVTNARTILLYFNHINRICQHKMVLYYHCSCIHSLSIHIQLNCLSSSQNFVRLTGQWCTKHRSSNMY